jgi:hypothetical protein
LLGKQIVGDLPKPEFEFLTSLKIVCARLMPAAIVAPPGPDRDVSRHRPAVGELRVHDLITRFFSRYRRTDQQPWRRGARLCRRRGHRLLASHRRSHGRCVLCFFAIERSMARLAADYRREFDLLWLSGMGCTPVLSANVATPNANSPFRRHHARRGAAMRALQGGRSAVGGLGICCVTGQPSDLGGQSIAVRGGREQVAAHMIQHA